MKRTAPGDFMPGAVHLIRQGVPSQQSLEWREKRWAGGFAHVFGFGARSLHVGKAAIGDKRHIAFKRSQISELSPSSSNEATPAQGVEALEEVRREQELLQTQRRLQIPDQR